MGDVTVYSARRHADLNMSGGTKTARIWHCMEERLHIRDASRIVLSFLQRALSSFPRTSVRNFRKVKRQEWSASQHFAEPATPFSGERNEETQENYGFRYMPGSNALCQWSVSMMTINASIFHSLTFHVSVCAISSSYHDPKSHSQCIITSRINVNFISVRINAYWGGKNTSNSAHSCATGHSAVLGK